MDYNDIKIEHREGMTVLPPDVDPVTGDVIGDAHVFNYRNKHPFFREEEMDSSDEDIEQDALSPDDQDPEFEMRLADTFDELNSTPYDVNPALAFEIASADIGGTRADSAVQLFTSQVFNGDLSPEEAFRAAIDTGISADELMNSYYKLQRLFNQ